MIYRSHLVFPWGALQILADEEAVFSVARVEVPEEDAENRWSRLAKEELRRYFTGTLKTFTVPIRPSGTAFQQAVWQALREIPCGAAVCYQQIADRIGRPTAVRAAAQAIGRNPILILIPCHRVVGKDGSLTGFSAGLDLKELLLKLEAETA